MFITNHDGEGARENMSERINEVLPYAKTFDVLVGFFFFSGLNAVEKGLRENPNVKIRILVGMDAEICCGRAVEVFRSRKNVSKENILDQYLVDLKKVLCLYGDAKGFEEKAKLFCELLSSGRLEIRKTKEENHAKLYLFEMDARAQDLLPHTWMMGSSNFTAQGLVNRQELNIEPVKLGYKDARAYFDELWEKGSIDLTVKKEEMIRIVTEESPIADVSPYEAYLLLLRKYIDAHEGAADDAMSVHEILEEPKDEFSGKPKYTPFRYQIDAINQAKGIVRQYGGVIIADVVGLGKSLIGSVLVRAMGGRRHRGVVIAPPGLVGSESDGTGWWGYLQDFKLTGRGWSAMSRGKLEDVAKKCRIAAKEGDPIEFVLVDEAHYFRNEDIGDYETLSEICRGKKVILMTATPFGNCPRDILSLLRLFMREMRESDLLNGEDLEKFFLAAQRDFENVHKCQKNLALAIGPKTGDKKRDNLRKWVREMLVKLCGVIDVSGMSEAALKARLRAKLGRTAKEIRSVVGHVMIRRNRLDLVQNPDYKSEVGRNLATVKDPQEQLFELTPEQSSFYDRVIGTYFGPHGFTGAAYQPIMYSKFAPDAPGAEDEDESATVDDDHRHKRQQQQNMYKFMLRLLVRRFESSFAAFHETVDRMIRAHEEIRWRAFVKKPGFVAISEYAKNLPELADLPDDFFGNLNFVESDEIVKLREQGEVYSIEDDFDEVGRARFKADLEADIQLFKGIKKEVDELGLLRNDPKVKKLIESIRVVLNGGLGREDKDPEKRKVLIFSEFSDTVKFVAEKLKGAFPGRVLQVSDLSNSVRNTILRNFDASCGAQDDFYDVLISTDKISEGFNLNRAGVVVNYDIPWNPVRVIQRVGRINRIGKRVFRNLFIFNFFPTEQGAEVAQQRTIVERKMFMIHQAIGEDAKIFSEDEEPIPSKLYEKLSKNPEDDEEVSFYTRAKKAFENARKSAPETVARVEKLPLKVKTFWSPAKDAKAPRTLLFARRGNVLSASSLMVSDDPQEAVKRELVEDAIEAIACKAGTPKNAGLSDGFWERYAKLQGRTEDDEPVVFSRGNNQSPAEKARRRIESELQARNCGEWESFAKEIRDDILYHRTLPEFTLRAIAKVGNESGAFAKYLQGLHGRLGSLKYEDDKVPVEWLIAEDLQKAN